MTTTTNLWTNYTSQWSRVPPDLKRRYGSITTFCEHHCNIADHSPSGQMTPHNSLRQTPLDARKKTILSSVPEFGNAVCTIGLGKGNVF